MYRSVLFLHWKQIRVVLLPFVVSAFGLPLLSVQGMGTPGTVDEATVAYVILATNQDWLGVFPLLAWAIGITLALSAWNWDHQLGHVYSLSLPLPRWQFAALKMGAGALLTALPALAFWVGVHLAAASVTLPVGLHAYPDALALRFFLCVLVSYAAFFALAAGTVRTTVTVVLGLLLFIVLGDSLNSVLARFFTFFQHTNVIQAVFDLATSPHGPLAVFFGSWTLIDV